MIRSQAATSAVMVVIFLCLVVWAFTFGPTARVMPLLVGIPGLLLSTVQLRNDLASHFAAKAEKPELTLKEIHMLFWLAGCVGLIILFGFALGSGLAVAAYFHFSLHTNPWRTGVAASASFILFEGIFKHLLATTFFEGLAFGAFP